MPLSKEQMALLKDGNTPIKFAKDNPKKVGSKAWDRYEQYKDATSIAQATEKKAGWQDLTADFEKGFLKILMDIDGEGQGVTKRPAPEGTPDREAQARTKTHASEMIPRSLPTELQDPISKVEMSAATIAALRMVVREEITNGMSAMENRVTNKMDEQIGKMQQDMEEEKQARLLLETRLQILEQKENLKSSPGHDMQEVDKSIAVVGGFGEKTVEEAEELLRELLAHVDGFHEVTMVDSNTVVGLAQFHSPVQAMKFIRSQKKNEQIQKSGLWVSENRSRSERNRTKAVSKKEDRQRYEATSEIRHQSCAGNVAKYAHIFGNAHPGSTKRGAPAGTPDREADARSKMHSSAAMVPKVLIPEANDPISKVEMSAATITALRAMMREEITNGMLEMEDRLSKKLEQAIGNMKDEVKIETEARQQLEERIARLETNSALKQGNSSQDKNYEFEDVDKAVAVVGGFVDKTVEELEALVEEMMRGVQGYKEMEIVDINPPIALATFDSPMQAMKFIRGQKRNPTVQTNKLWVSENRSRMERMRCKAVSKLKKFLIELGGLQPANIIVNYKKFSIMARINGKNAYVGDDLGIEWLDKNIVNEDVRTALETFLSELE
eukprot:symbB.v1.2.025326.t1/scaffold2451.1/size78874/11